MRGGAGPLAVGVGVAGLGLFLLLGAQTIPGEAAYAGVGPRAFPTVIGATLVVFGIAFVIAVRRGAEFPNLATPAQPGVFPWVLGGLVGATVLVEHAGFPVAATLLFAFAARAFGSRRWAANLLLGALLGVVIWVAFARMLGISLPGGPLGAVPDTRRIAASSVGPDPQRTEVRLRSGPPCVLARIIREHGRSRGRAGPVAANGPTVLTRTPVGDASTRCGLPLRGRTRAAAETSYAPRGGAPRSRRHPSGHGPRRSVRE